VAAYSKEPADDRARPGNRTLFRPPEQRTSKAGKPFVSATVRVKDGDEWVVTQFEFLLCAPGAVIRRRASIS
jgi:hypothetical protein